MLGLLVEGMGCSCHLDGPAVKWERMRVPVILECARGDVLQSCVEIWKGLQCAGGVSCWPSSLWQSPS